MPPRSGTLQGAAAIRAGLTEYPAPVGAYPQQFEDQNGQTRRFYDGATLHRFGSSVGGQVNDGFGVSRRPAMVRPIRKAPIVERASLPLL